MKSATESALSKARRSIEFFLEHVFRYLARPVLRRFVSKKRISWGFFQELTKVIKKEIQINDLIYINSEKLSDYLNVGKFNSRILIAGGSDHDVTRIEFEKMTNLPEVTFFVQNLDYREADNVKFLPIGIQDLKWASSGLPWNFSRRFMEMQKSRKILVGPFSPTHIEREKCLESGRLATNCVVVETKLPSFEYARLSSQYAFVACPRGNGLDTHRIWETLYRGSIPVLTKSSFSKNLIAYGLPVLEIDAWDELKSYSSSDLQSVFSQAQISDYAFLSQKWWKERLVTL